MQLRVMKKPQVQMMILCLRWNMECHANLVGEWALTA
jgi:hypothetical protein